jgi:hypothetical protein
MEDFNFISYFEDMANNLKTVANFFRASNIRELEEFLANTRSAEGISLVVLDNSSGSLDDASMSDNLLDREFYTFFLLGYVDNNDMEARQGHIQLCKNILRSILSKMFKDRINYISGMENIRRSSINYDTVGPIASSNHGLMIHFSIDVPTGIKYNPEDWINP